MASVGEQLVEDSSLSDREVHLSERCLGTVFLSFLGSRSGTAAVSLCRKGLGGELSHHSNSEV